MKILITGANGYLGANLVEHFYKQGAEIYGLVRSVPDNSQHWQSKFKHLVVGDIRDRKTLDSLNQLDVTYVIHTISLDHKISQAADSNTMLAVNVQPTLDLLKIFSAKAVEKFIYFSTQQVYGRLKPVDISESYPTNPLNIYGLTHLMCENICNYFNSTSETRCINIRLSNSIGKPIFLHNNCWWLVVNDFCKSAMQQKYIKILSDGTPQRDFIHMDDVAKGIEVLLKSSITQMHPNIYNLGSGITYQIWEVAQMVVDTYCELYGETIQILGADAQVFHYHQSTDVPKFHYDVNRLCDLGFQNKRNLKDGIKTVLSYLAESGTG